MNIRYALLAAGSALALSASAAGALAAGTVSATANASATVIAPTSITKTQDMLFGSLVRPTLGTTTFTLDASDHVTAVGGNGSVIASTTTSAKFDIFSTSSIVYTLSPTLSFTQPGLTNVTVGPVATTNGTPGQVTAGGTQEIRYGASFDVGIATTPQNYTGTLSVVVTYN
jgi:hypothetical protein